MFFFKRKKRKKAVAQSNIKRNAESTNNDLLIQTTTASVISSSSDYGGYNSNHSTSCSSHSSYDSGSSFDGSSSCDWSSSWVFAFYFGGGWRMESITKIIANLERSVNDLQRDNDGMKQALLNVLTNVEALNRKVNMLEETLATKVGITHVQQLIKQ